MKRVNYEYQEDGGSLFVQNGKYPPGYKWPALKMEAPGSSEIEVNV
jgi:hypothetical protein